MPASGNLFKDIPADLSAEWFETLAEGAVGGTVRVERIVSRGQATPAGEWCDQPQREFVVLLTGSATLRFEGQGEPLRMRPGDWVQIPPHARHRVDATDPDADSVWLAVHFG